jgi:rhamnose transport system ATP-binding protein
MASELTSESNSQGGPVVADESKPKRTEPALKVEHVRKYFGAVHALEDASLELFAGEAHGLVGENGAGKSTLVRILAGVFPPESGTLFVNGRETVLNGPADARDAGIAVIYQEPTLFPDLTVAENMFMGRQPLLSGRRIDRRAVDREASKIFERLGVRLDPHRIARGLSIADQQIVEIGKAFTLDAKVIVMDEPTAALSAVEVDRLFTVVRTLCSEGAAVLFISHRLEDVFVLCEEVTVFRDGRQVLTSPTAGLTGDDLVRAMVGREVEDRSTSTGTKRGDVVLEVRHLSREGVFMDVSFDVHAGEIVALSGLVGAGRSEVACAIFGIDRYDAGTVTMSGSRLRKGSPTAAMDVGIGLIPEDRRLQGLVMEMSVERNIALASLARLRTAGVIRTRRERSFARDWALQLRVRYGRLSDSVSTLSGGNQQKAVLAKWLARQPKLLIVDEPTRGIDVATKAEVHRLMFELAANGVAILMISSELLEVLHVADRILVMREGRIVSEVAHADATEERIVGAATGQMEVQAS